jgi:hypothetical protein
MGDDSPIVFVRVIVHSRIADLLTFIAAFFTNDITGKILSAAIVIERLIVS